MDFLLSQDTIEYINEAIDISKGDSEWTINFTNEYPWTKDVFDTVCMYLRSNYNEKIEQEVLSVIGDTTILEVTGLGNISKYCYAENTEGLDKDSFVWKNCNIKSQKVLPDEFPMFLTSEIKEFKKIEPISEWDSIAKQYYITKTFDYEQYKLKIIKGNDDVHLNMIESGVSTGNLKYVIQLKCNELKIDEIVELILNMIQMITGVKFPISKTQQKEILIKYDALIHKDIKNKEKDEYYYFAPKPITLEAINLTEPNGVESYGITSIYSNYAVTDKADGERMLMYINDDGLAYLINNSFEVSYSGLRCKNKELINTLLDGEYVSNIKRTDGGDTDIFAVFDVYHVNGKKVTGLPLFAGTNGIDMGDNSRYGKYVGICKSENWSDQKYTEIRAKEHVPADGQAMKDACKMFLTNSVKLPYYIDGLIFTPRLLSVFGYYPNKPIEIPMNSRWDKVLKWKPPEQNSIDFLVRLGEKVRDLQNNKVYQRVKLYTGYNAAQWEPITPMIGLQLRYDKVEMEKYRNMLDLYKEKLFEPVTYNKKGISIAEIELDADGNIFADDGSKIENNSIVEFAYDVYSENNVSRKWKPMRVRVDKTRVYQKTGKLSKTANDLKVATNIWRSIHSPVTNGVLTGEIVKDLDLPDTLEERLLSTDDVYYAREIHRSHMLSVHMLNFHNHGIKRMLYQKAVNKDALIEFACGMAGDLPRWRECGFKFILGIDLSRDNITKPDGGAWSRLLKQSRAVKQIVGGVEELIYPNVVFVVGDCALPVHNAKTAEGVDPESVRVLQTIYSQRDNRNPITKFIAGRGLNKFSIASCMFAIHYFFKNEETLRGFLYNVSYNLKRDGIFICTFMDGKVVANMLETNNGIVEGRKLDDKVPVWAIIKRYKDKAFSESNYGQIVDVFLENTNKLISEYLINFDFLVEIAKEFELELDSSEMFSEEFNRILRNEPNNKDVRELNKDAVQKQFSFVNRWAVFKKL